MIIEGSTHPSAKSLARYLLRTREGETARLIEISDQAGEHLADALSDWECCGRSLTKGKRILLHSYIRIRDGESLTSEQWQQVINELETQLGLSGHSRAIVAHEIADRGLHVHVVWSRFNPITETLAPLHHDRRAFHSVARWAEQEFGLQPVEVQRRQQRGNRKQRDRDTRALRDRGINLDDVTAAVRKAWKTTTTGEAFKAALEHQGIVLSTGTRAAFIIDVDGLYINPVRMLEGVSTAEFRARMRSVELPTERMGADLLRKRRATNAMRDQLQAGIANDGQPSKLFGFNRTRRRRDDWGMNR